MRESSDETLDASSDPLAAADRSSACVKGTMTHSKGTSSSPDVSDRGDERVVGEAGGGVGGGVEVGAEVEVEAGAVTRETGGSALARVLGLGLDVPLVLEDLSVISSSVVYRFNLMSRSLVSFSLLLPALYIAMMLSLAPGGRT